MARDYPPTPPGLAAYVRSGQAASSHGEQDDAHCGPRAAGALLARPSDTPADHRRIGRRGHQPELRTAINDPDPRQRSVTYLLAPLTAAGALTLGVLLVRDQVLSDVAFVAIMFIATAARRFGPRGTALGLLAFWTYFLAILLHAALAQVPWFLLATVVGAACAFLLGTWLLPDRPERLLGGLCSVLEVRVAAILSQLRATVAARQITPRARTRLISSVAQLHATALAIEELADRVDPGTVWSGVTPDQLTQAVVTVEMAAEQVVNRYWQFALIAEHLCRSGDPTVLAGGWCEGKLKLRGGNDDFATTGQLHAEEREVEQHRVLAAEQQLEAALHQLRMARTELEALTSGHVPRVPDALDRVLRGAAAHPLAILPRFPRRRPRQRAPRPSWAASAFSTSSSAASGNPAGHPGGGGNLSGHSRR